MDTNAQAREEILEPLGQSLKRLLLAILLVIIGRILNF